MTKKKPVLDTNLIIRFLTEDNPIQAKKVKALLEKATEKSLWIPDLIIAEITYVLLSFYQLPKSQVITKITALINFPKIKTNQKILRATLHLYQKNNISFADAYLGALVKIKKASFLYTFDQKLIKIKEFPAKKP